MKKTLIAAVCAAFVSTGAFAGPAPKHNTPSHNNSSHIVEHQVKKPASIAKQHNPKPTHVAKHHKPKPVHVAKHQPKPAPHIVHHHHHNHLDLGDALIAFAILATAAIN